jgi:transposase
MALGKRCSEQQGEFWVPTDKLGSGPRNVFYERLNQLLAEMEFDRKLEAAAEPHYETTGRKGLPPGVYFRMIFIGFFEDISSQRGIAWRCDDSKSLARFLGYAPGEATPDHSTLSLTRGRLPMEIHHLAFELVLKAAQDHGLLKGKTVGVDATDLEANASMKSIVRRDSGDDWREYLRKLYEEETGESDPDDEELRRFDKRRKNKKVSNEEWVSETDPDARIGKMKDGRTHLKYKAENAVDLDTEIIVAAEVYHGDYGDTTTIEDTVNMAQAHLNEAETDCEIEEVAADKGYHSEDSLDRLQNESRQRTYIPEPARKTNRTWKNKPPGREAAYRRNRRNTTGARGRRLQRLRSERVERTFAHLCDTGGARRTWLRGLEKVQKRYQSAAMAFNLGRIMRSLMGAGKPRHFAVLAETLCLAYFVMTWRYEASPSLTRRTRTMSDKILHPVQFLAA